MRTKEELQHETIQITLFGICAMVILSLILTHFQGCDRNLTQRDETARFINEGYTKQINQDGSYKWEKSGI